MMTIAIAPILAKLPVQTAGTDSPAAADTATAGADFASLLLGQLVAGTDLQQGIASNPETPVTAESLGPEALDPAASPQDAAMLLASLGMAPAQQNSKIATDGVETGTEPALAVDTRLVGNDRKASAVLLTGTPASSTAADAARPATSLEAGSQTQNSLPAPPEQAEKAAKFAVLVPAEPKIDTLSIKNIHIPGEAGAIQQTPVTAALAPQASNAALASSNHLKMDTPVRDVAWPGDFAQKVVWLTNNDQKFAQITLNPPQMGPIEISLNINKDNASAYFVSANAEVREAIETALPRLREMLAGVGIELGQANVSAQSSRQEAGNPDGRHGAPRWMSDETILGGDSGPGQASITRRGSGLVDTFA